MYIVLYICFIQWESSGGRQISKMRELHLCSSRKRGHVGIYIYNIDDIDQYR